MEDVETALALVELAREFGPNAVFWSAFAAGFWFWWRTLAEHLCRVIPQMIDIADKFATNGVNVNLNVTSYDGDADCKKEEEPPD